MKRLEGTALFGLIVVGVLVVDRLTKLVVRQTLEVGESFPTAETLVGRAFSFTRVSNTGIAFGMFQGRNDLLIVTSLAVVAAILVYRLRVPAQDKWLQVAFGLQVGGALGNVIDRLLIGHVTDFLDFKVWPVFNVSDLAIFGGVAMLAWHLWQEEKRAVADDQADDDSSGPKDLEPSSTASPGSPNPGP